MAAIAPLAVAVLGLAAASGAAATCHATRFPAIAQGSLKTSLVDMARADHFELDWWVDQDALVDQPAGSSIERAEALSRRFNTIVQYRPDAACGLRIARLWVLPVAAARPATAPASAARAVVPAPPDAATLQFLQAHSPPTAR